jgi:CHAD domain-containing protein
MAASSVARASEVRVAIAPDTRADAAAVAVLRRLLTVIVDNLDGSIAGLEDEHLHQLRIAVRRTRTVQRQLGGVFAAGELPGLRADFRWLARATGPARDLDVHVAELEALAQLLPADQRDDLRPLRPVLLHERLTARAAMARSLTSDRAGSLLEDWERLLETLVERPTEDRPDAGRPAGELVARRIAVLYRRVVRCGRRLGPDSPSADFHAVRRTGKDLRYLLELFGPSLLGSDRVGDLILHLRRLQDVLGRHQDRVVQRALLIAVADEVAGLPGGGAACLAMGVLADRLAADARSARTQFSERLDAFSRGGPRREVRRLSAR